MSRPCVISLLAPHTVEAAHPEDLEASVRQMQAFWRTELRKICCDQPDLIVLPEACDRFTNIEGEQRKAYYRVRGAQMLHFFEDVARKQRCYIAYSAARLLIDGTWRNSTTMIGRKGEIVGIYDKNHLVIGENTENGMLCGDETPAFACDFGRVCCAICFDLNFEPVLRKTMAQHPDLIVFSSMYHGDMMQPLWAYACRSYFVGCIRGQTSTIVNPVGMQVAQTTNYFSHLSCAVNLDYAVVHLDENWDRIDAAKQKYGMRLTMRDPGFLGAVLLTNEGEGTIDEILAEFQIERLDEYFERSLAHRLTCLAPKHVPGTEWRFEGRLVP